MGAAAPRVGRVKIGVTCSRGAFLHFAKLCGAEEGSADRINGPHDEKFQLGTVEFVRVVSPLERHDLGAVLLTFKEER